MNLEYSFSSYFRGSDESRDAPKDDIDLLHLFSGGLYYQTLVYLIVLTEAIY